VVYGREFKITSSGKNKNREGGMKTVAPQGKFSRNFLIKMQ
jgi:hypothetical protein